MHNKKPVGRCGVLVRQKEVTQFDDFSQPEEAKRTFALHWSLFKNKYELTLFVHHENRWMIVASRHKQTGSTQLHLAYNSLIHELANIREGRF